MGGISYGELIRINVRRKWPTPELKEWWYSKFTMSRRKKLIKLYTKQEGRCIFCGCETWLGNVDRVKQKPPGGMQLKQLATADHVIPQSHGGTDRSSNLRMACSDCNNRRQTMDFTKFMEIRRDPEKWKNHNRSLTAEYQRRSKERGVKSEARAQALVWKLAVLFIVRPDLIEVAKSLPNVRRGNRPPRDPK